MVVLHKLQKYYGIATLGYLGHHIVSILGITQTISGGGNYSIISREKVVALLIELFNFIDFQGPKT
jgi:hypothetical protein